ncbi:hypothetical protein DENIS_0254 [Desulfonema ishimotonii]|uniref:Methyltransferase small domain-containing protein n=1 Tax=Desulfonema ishimotonii TaxID=45657 RepID=A0A401FQS8_9BACT|nr:methyltransferase [Desulfonema ishimotonii]GBC59317.1 hypothetical protein DENIS_0254 [Desulfonema ishimotonii]
MADLLTSDTFFEGRIRVRQYRNGYRFSIDAVLLAHYAAQWRGGTVLDLGTGCGIIPMILAYRRPAVRIYGVEIQEALADIAAANIAANGMSDRITVLRQDMKTLTAPEVGGPVDMVVTNPPYRKAASGRMNPHMQRAIARHEVAATLSDVVETARRMLRVSGHFVAVYLAERTAELLSRMRASGIEPKSLRPIQSFADTDARLILAEGTQGGRPGMKIHPPLVIYTPDGAYTEEVSGFFLP